MMAVTEPCSRSHEIHHVFVDGNLTTAHATMRGTHEGGMVMQLSLLPPPPSGAADDPAPG